MSADATAPIEIVDIEKPDWLDVCAEPSDGSLPAELSLIANRNFDKMNSVVDARIGLVLGAERRKVEIALLFLPSVTNGASQ